MKAKLRIKNSEKLVKNKIDSKINVVRIIKMKEK